MKNGAKIMVTGVETRKSKKRLSATVKAANSRNIFFTASLFILGLLTGSLLTGRDFLHVFPPHQQALFFVPAVESWEKSITKNTSQEGGTYALHHIFSPAVNSALSANYARNIIKA